MRIGCFGEGPDAAFFVARVGYWLAGADVETGLLPPGGYGYYCRPVSVAPKAASYNPRVLYGWKCAA